MDAIEALGDVVGRSASGRQIFFGDEAQRKVDEQLSFMRDVVENQEILQK